MLQLAFKEKKRKPVELNRSRVTIGRDKSNSMVLKDEGISGFHAEIHMDEGNIFIMDLNSTNGTKVNGEKITTRQPVEVWDVIEFDKVKLENVETAAVVLTGALFRTALYYFVKKRKKRGYSKKEIVKIADEFTDIFLPGILTPKDQSKK
jgi:pSer/pThr/pTyr-binding forkhead associated (FHA) protein